jgi:hypothetical protein
MESYMSYVEIDPELLIIAANHDQEEVSRRIKEMSPEDRRVLRMAIELIDKALDGVVIEERLKRLRDGQGSEE